MCIDLNKKLIDIATITIFFKFLLLLTLFICLWVTVPSVRENVIIVIIIDDQEVKQTLTVSAALLASEPTSTSSFWDCI